MTEQPHTPDPDTPEKPGIDRNPEHVSAPKNNTENNTDSQFVKGTTMENTDNQENGNKSPDSEIPLTDHENGSPPSDSKEFTEETTPSQETPSEGVEETVPSFKKKLTALIFGEGRNLGLSVCIFFSLISATLMILAFPNTGWYPLAFVAWVPLLLVVETQSKWKVSICYALFLLIFYYYILDWIEVFHTYALPGLVFYVTLIHFIPLFIYKFFRRWNKIGSIYNAFLFATIMVIFEYCRELGFARFPYGNIGYTQYRFLSFIQIADITGYLGISYFIYFVNAATAGALAKLIYTSDIKNKNFFDNKKPLNYVGFFLLNRFALIGIIFSLILLYGNRQFSPENKKIWSGESGEEVADTSTATNQDVHVTRVLSTKKIKVSMIQHWYDYNLEWTEENRNTLLDKLFRLTSKAIEDKPDIIIWSESALNDFYEYRVANQDNNPNALALHYYRFFNEVSRDHPEIKFLTGSLSLGEVKDETIVEKKSRTAKDVKTGSISGNIDKYNSSLFINNRGEVIDKGAKMLLVPVGEYFPYQSILNAIPWFAGILDEAQASQFTPFDRFKVFNYEKGFFSTLICYEDAFEFLSRTLVLHGASFLVLITNDAWGYSVKSQEVHFMFSIFRAIENRRHVIRVGNAGVTGIIDPWGKPDKVLPMFEEGLVTTEFTPVNDRLSSYTQFGNLFIALLVIIFVLLIHYSLIMKFWHLFLWSKKNIFSHLRK